MVEILLALILALTGIQRDVDPGLTDIAEQRVVESITDFSHAGQVCCWEILAANDGYPDPIAHAVEQWHGSPVHFGILADRTLTRIGCAIAQDGTAWYFACILDTGPVQAAPTAPADSAPDPLLPNTAQPAP